MQKVQNQRKSQRVLMQLMGHLSAEKLWSFQLNMLKVEELSVGNAKKKLKRML